MKKTNRTVITDGTVAIGSATGHRHQLAAGAVLCEEGGQRIVEGHGGSMVHEEHGQAMLGEIEYDVGRVLEYDHFAEEARQVVD